MRHETAKFLYDIRQACDLLHDFTRDKSLDDYLSDPLLRSAVERQLMIVGEALSQALKIDPALADAITDARRIVNFRNVIVHGYAAIEPQTVWGIL